MIPKSKLFLKIAIIPAIATVILLFILALNTYTTSKNKELLEEAELIQFPLLNIADRKLINLERSRDNHTSAVTTGDEDVYLSAVNFENRILTDLNKAKEIAPRLTGELNTIQTLFTQYTSSASTVTNHMLTDGDITRILEEIEKMNQLYTQVKSQMELFRDERLGNFTQAINTAKENAQNATLSGFIIGIFAILGLFGASIPIANKIVKSIADVVTSLKDIAQGDGDLRVRIEQSTQDEIGELVHWFNTFMVKLQNVIQEIIKTVEPLTELSKALDQFTNSSKKNVDIQLDRSNSMMDSVQSFNESFAQVSTNAESAAEATAETVTIAEKGQREIKNTIITIGALSNNINESSRAISQLDTTTQNVSQVIGVINAIAEQTNLLALNASIEAARAGEQGRGFAVVADEVRSLATKTRKSTEEIEAIISSLRQGSSKAVSMMKASTEKTSECVETVKQAGNQFEAILEKIDANNLMNKEIASTTLRQQELTQSLEKNATAIKDDASTAYDSTQKLAENINHLVKTIQSLNQISQQFKI